MHSAADHHRYLPSSVGTLMDPAFLRRAVNDGVAVQAPAAAGPQRAHVGWWWTWGVGNARAGRDPQRR